MADSQHVTLTADTVATMTFDRDYDTIEVINVDGAAAVYFTINGDDPEVEGAGTIVLPAAIGGVEIGNPLTGQLDNSTVKLISAGTPKVSVRVW